MAQIDLSGSWAARQYGDALSNQPGPEPTPVDYLGLPLNESGRLRALAYSYSQLSSADRVCGLFDSSGSLLKSAMASSVRP